ncbi:unnamed protein product [Darwinula stevensoni]|uniref:Uncharacterized protein n=1 Tax=Darwinula stevensoni TaxID=69355 RepID=A0A7R8X3D6_9CRUS|nr:unnamed protein product [Darwinula stevensoni]CAG0884408.1 unnamed protein product [Darwinula stevensoni]
MDSGVSSRFIRSANAQDYRFKHLLGAPAITRAIEHIIGKHEEYEDTTKSDPTMKNNLPFQKMQPGIDDPGVYYQYEPESMGFSDPFDRQIQTQSFHDNPAFEADDVEVYRRESVPRRSSQTQSSSQPAYSPIASHHLGPNGSVPDEIMKAIHKRYLNLKRYIGGPMTT